MTMPGTACIYYGTEIAMAGGHDPDCRRTMPWNAIEQGEFDAEMKELKNLIALRNHFHQTKGTDVIWHHDPQHSRLICFDRPGADNTLRVRLNGHTEAIRVQQNETILYARGFENDAMRPGGILITLCH